MQRRSLQPNQKISEMADEVGILQRVADCMHILGIIPSQILCTVELVKRHLDLLMQVILQL